MRFVRAFTDAYYTVKTFGKINVFLFFFFGGHQGKKHAQRVQVYLQTKKAERNKQSCESSSFQVSLMLVSCRFSLKIFEISDSGAKLLFYAVYFCLD